MPEQWQIVDEADLKDGDIVRCIEVGTWLKPRSFPRDGFLDVDHRYYEKDMTADR